MDTSAPQWPQGIGVVKSVEKKARPPKEQALNCPRCSSTNTKFCYYNNYSLSQPRYFCKTCRRYWTEGGCLRNVPVGGGSRKNRRPSSSTPSPAVMLSSSANNSSDHNLNPNPNPNPKTIHGQDLNLAYNSIGMSEYIAMPFDSQNPNFPNTHHPLPVMEFFKPANVYNNGNNVSSGFPVMHDFKTGLGFSVEGYYGGNLQDGDSKNIVFPFGEMKQDQDHQQLDQLQERSQADQGGNGFWNGMLAGGSSW